MQFEKKQVAEKKFSFEFFIFKISKKIVILHNKILIWLMFANKKLTKKQKKKKRMQSFFIRLFDYFSQKRQFMKFELSAFRHAFFPIPVNSESDFSGQKLHMLEQKLRTTTINVIKNSDISKKHSLTSCFWPRMLTIERLDLFFQWRWTWWLTNLP